MGIKGFSRLPRERATTPATVNGRIAYLRGKVRILEVWFDDLPTDLSGYDLLVCNQRSKPISSHRWLYHYTIIFDLTQSSKQLLSQMNRTTAKEIRRAQEKDNFRCSITTSPTDNEIDNFLTFYSMNSQNKDHSTIDAERLHILNRSNLLGLSKVQLVDGTILVWRCNICHAFQGRVRGMYGASNHQSVDQQSIRNLIGRANRLLHYKEMLFFKENKYLIYDFGGWYAGMEDAKRLQINKFKEGFGGRIVYGYDCEEPQTLKGFSYVFMRSIKRRLFDRNATNEMKRRRQKAAHGPT